MRRCLLLIAAASFGLSLLLFAQPGSSLLALQGWKERFEIG